MDIFLQKPIDPQLTVEALKKMLNEPVSIRKQEEEQYRKQLCVTYRVEPFQELVSRNTVKVIAVTTYLLHWLLTNFFSNFRPILYKIR